jgi:hypothetical protein
VSSRSLSSLGCLLDQHGHVVVVGGDEVGLADDAPLAGEALRGLCRRADDATLKLAAPMAVHLRDR